MLEHPEFKECVEKMGTARFASICQMYGKTMEEAGRTDDARFLADLRATAVRKSTEEFQAARRKEEQQKASESTQGSVPSPEPAAPAGTPHIRMGEFMGPKAPMRPPGMPAMMPPSGSKGKGEPYKGKQRDRNEKGKGKDERRGRDEHRSRRG